MLARADDAAAHFLHRGTARAMRRLATPAGPETGSGEPMNVVDL
jgi:hypothetical protein